VPFSLALQQERKRNFRQPVDKSLSMRYSININKREKREREMKIDTSTLLVQAARAAGVALMIANGASSIEVFKLATSFIVSSRGLDLAASLPLVGNVYTRVGIATILWMFIQCFQVLPWVYTWGKAKSNGSNPNPRTGVEKAYLGLMRVIPLSDSDAMILGAPLIGYAIELLLNLLSGRFNPIKDWDGLLFDPLGSISIPSIVGLVLSMFVFEFLFLTVIRLSEILASNRKGGKGSSKGSSFGGGDSDSFGGSSFGSKDRFD
jgi:hypothetical protein